VTLRALLRLCRIPNVFTAVANVVAGVSLARAGAFQTRDLALLGTSAALYTAGMVWNDYFDREIDAQERPERPIPAGEVSPWAAAAIGGSLLAVGLELAVTHGPVSLAVALALTLSILLYNARLKHTGFGPLAMGACRALNVGLGLSALLRPEAWLFALPCLLGAFTYSITELSRFEVSGTAPAKLRRTVASFGGLFLLLMAALIWVSLASGAGALGLLLATPCVLFVFLRGRALFDPLRTDVSPGNLGRAIGGGILLMPAIDASFVAAAGAPWLAALTFALAGPAYLLKRWYYLT
jgi:4-hydroxybenzoate polyprenyltransferase